MKQLENKIMELNAKLPELPGNLKDIFAKWLWVGALISIVINVMGIMTILGMGAFTNFILISAGFQFTSIKIWIIIITGVVGMGITLVAELFAVKPLKELLYKGWYISFCVVCYQLVLSTIYDITSNTFSGIFSNLISFAISMYILAQTRGHFTEE